MEEGDPYRDSIPILGPYTSLVPPTSPWNTHGKCIIGIRRYTGAAIPPTLLYHERYKWLYATHSRIHKNTEFTQDLLRIMSRYNPKAKFLNPQGRSLKLANHYAIPSRLRHAIESSFLTSTELFGSPLNYSMAHGITYCSAFIPGGRGLRSNHKLLPIPVD